MALWNSQTTHNDMSGFSDNPELRKELKIWRLKIAAWVLLLSAIVGFSARPAYRAFREYRINNNLEAAKAAARLEDWGTARDKARSVLLVRNQDFEAFRIWARALGKMGEPRTYMAAARLFSDPRSNREDRLEALQVMALQAPHAVALGAYASLSEDLRKLPSFRAAITPLLVLRGQIELAEKGLREVGQPTDEPKVRLELLRVLCARPQAERVAEARQIFADLIATRADEEALAALLILGGVKDGLAPGEPLPDLPEWLRQQPKATAIHHLFGMQPSLEALPEMAQRNYESAIERFLATEPGILGTWLTGRGQAEKALEILEEPAKTRSDAYIAYLSALLKLHKDAEITAALVKPPETADLVEIEVIRAAIATNRNDKIAADAAWTRALDKAAFDSGRNRFIELARTAEGYGAKKSVDDAWVASIRSGWGQLPLYQDLLPVFASLAFQGRSEDLLAMYRTMLRFEPNNSELINNFHYIALIQGIVPPDKVSEILTQLYEKNPEVEEINSTLMLAEMMGGHFEAAMTRLPKLHTSRKETPTMVAALEGTAKILAGETEAGKALLKDINWLACMRQERIVFRDLLVKLKISGLPLPELESLNTEAAPDQIPAWRKAVERLEKDRASDVLPSLPALRLPGADSPVHPTDNP